MLVTKAKPETQTNSVFDPNGIRNVSEAHAVIVSNACGSIGAIAQRNSTQSSARRSTEMAHVARPVAIA
jgi:hypothetical protein